jgi:hypothetical protein
MRPQAGTPVVITYWLVRPIACLRSGDRYRIVGKGTGRIWRNLSTCKVVHCNCHMDCSGIEPRHGFGEPAYNHLNCAADY